MKHSSRRILALLLALSLCIGMMPMSIFADEPETTGDPVAAETVLDLADEKTDEPAAEDKKVDEVVTEPAAEDKKVDEVVTEPAAGDKKVDEVVTEPAAEDKKDDEVVTEPAAEDKKVDEVVVDETEEDLDDVEDEAVVENAAKAVYTLKASGVWYSDFHLGYNNANGNEVIIGKPTGDTITPPSYREFPNCPYTEDQFVGWNWNGNRIDFASSHFMSNSAYQFYAVWRQEGETWVTVSFKTGLGDNEAIFETQVKSGDKASMAPPPANSYNVLKAKDYKGFRFGENWFLLDDLYKVKSDFNYEDDWEIVKDVYPYYFDNNHTINTDSVFVPKWIKTWEVTFVDETGEDVADPKIVDHNSKVAQPMLKAQAGYKYSWYYLDENEEEKLFDFNTPITSDLQLHLKKSAIGTVKYFMVYPDGFVERFPYTVEYDRLENADEVQMFEVATFEETGFKAPKGYVFRGWKVVAEDPSPVQIQPGTGNWQQEVMKKPALMPVAKMQLKSRLADSDDTSVKENEPDVIVQPGDELELHVNNYLVPVWGAIPRVTYHTEYPEITGLLNGSSSYEYTDADKTFTVLTFEKAFENTDFKVPAGFKFVCWRMYVSDVDDDFIDHGDVIGPGTGTITPIYDDEVKRSVDTREAKKEVLDVVKATPAQEESSVFIPAEATDGGTLVNGSDQEDVTPDGQGYVETTPGKVEDMHLRVHLVAVWEPYCKVIYHRVMPKSDFAQDKGIEDATYEVDYSAAQIEEAEEKFIVLDYESTKLEGISGYEFDYWTMEWDDLYNQITPRPDPGTFPIYPGEVERPEIEHLVEAEASQEYYKEVKVQDAKVLRAASSSEAEKAVKAEVAEKEMADVAEKEKVDVNEKEKIDVTEKDKIDVAEKDDVEKIMPGDEEDMHFVVHLYAWWKEKPYTVIWIDWTKDGGSVENPLTTGEYKPETFDPEKFDPEIEYKENKGPVRDPKVINDVTYVFDHWELKESEDDHTLIYEAIYKAPYNVIWIDEGGDVKDPLTTGGYNEYDSDTFDPAKEYEANKGPELKDKVVDGNTYTFDHWEPKENVDDNTFVYEAAYRPVENQTNPPAGGSNTPTTNPTTNTPAEDVSEIENNETPLAPATVDPVEDVDDEEIAANETPLAGFEVEPEEEDEIAEEATPLSPFTGDDRNTVVWGIVSILSLLGIVLVARKRREE